MGDPGIDFIIGHNLHRRRALAGLTQAEFGKLCSRPLTPQQISKYELGLSQITASYLIEFSRVLKCQLLDLLEGCEYLIVPKGEASREDITLMKNYKDLPEHLRDSVREMVRAMAMEGARNHVDGQ